MYMNSYFGTKRLLRSERAEQGAVNLLKRLREGELQMDILPNTYEKFNGELEEQDYVSYCSFLPSHNGRLVLDMLEEEDVR